MFSKYSCLFLVLNVLVFSESAFVDTLSKCPIKDTDCHKKLLKKVLGDIDETGIPELDVGPIDPMKLENITVQVLDVLEITLIEGQLKGIKNCAIDRYELNVEDERAYVEITCNVITLKGKYKAFSSSPVVKNLLNGQEVRGNGNAKVKIEKLKLSFDFSFYIQKRDGELYIKCRSEETKYNFDIKGKMLFAADNIYVGEVESSKLVVGMLNDNWKLLMGSFGKPFMDKATSIFFDFIHKLTDAIPLKYFISDDLSSYARD